MKNGRIQFWRIVFTYLIAYYHLNNAYGYNKSWYLGVEFFFIVSGYLLVAKFEKLSLDGKIEEYGPLKYTWDKYERFLPHTAYAFCVAFVITGIYKNYSIKEFIKGFFTHIPELFLVDAVGLNLETSFFYNSVTWYLSVLLISGYFIWYFMKKNKRVYLELIIPLSLILIYPYFFREYGSLAEHREIKYVIMNSALLRGIADINCGIIAYFVSKKIVSWKNNSKVLALVSDVLFICAICVSSISYRDNKDFLVLLLLFCGVVLGFSCDWNPLFNNKVIYKWAEMSLAIYLNHKIFRSAMKMICPERGIVVYLLWFAFITIYSFITYFGINWVISQLSKKKHEAT